MVLDDHINLMPDNPLREPSLIPPSHDFPTSPRFITSISNKGFGNRTIARIEGSIGSIWDSPVPVRLPNSCFLKLGADAVGMSTVPEAMLGNAHWDESSSLVLYRTLPLASVFIN